MHKYIIENRHFAEHEINTTMHDPHEQTKYRDESVANTDDRRPPV